MWNQMKFLIPKMCICSNQKFFFYFGNVSLSVSSNYCFGIIIYLTFERKGHHFLKECYISVSTCIKMVLVFRFQVNGRDNTNKMLDFFFCRASEFEWRRKILSLFLFWKRSMEEFENQNLPVFIKNWVGGFLLIWSIHPSRIPTAKHSSALNWHSTKKLTPPSGFLAFLSSLFN